MRLVFVHGMNQQGKDPQELRLMWEHALRAAWQRDGILIPNFESEMPFYGNVLDELTRKARGKNQNIIQRGTADKATFDAQEIQLYLALKNRAGISDEEVRAELGQEVVTRGPLNWEWVQGIARVLTRKAPWLGEAGLQFVRQVSAYLTRPHIQQKVDAIVNSALEQPCIVIAHSLGTVVSYRLLRALTGRNHVRLFVTLGSPLAIDVVKQYIRPPSIEVPIAVNNWLNASDERDYVALVSRLDRISFCAGIENISDVKNRRDDPHFIGDYLADSQIARRIAEALR